MLRPCDGAPPPALREDEAPLDVGDLDRLTRLPRALDHGAGRQVADATAREGLTLAGLDELVLHDGVGDAVDLDLEAFADVGGLHGEPPS